ncbi:hypothetical protein LCL96_02180 [Rossellomorea aquimaris]|uniref:hypothetical protein n=1 Tax=Rossellomorea aquimaris TaxID=189382 RepID=UPI001CD729B0|nr:hypothetical protein [Rossellomorea aquimaris]MCA1057720.1 hypothetical protein [Rossellomorea aquimaris]
MTVLERQIKKRETAECILRKLKLIERWSKLGDPYLVGAAAYGLMVSPDIDIETFSPELNPEQVLEMLTEVASDPDVLELKYRNYRNTPFGGCYFKLVYRYENSEDWTIDMWLFHQNYCGPLSRDMVQPMNSVLTERDRGIILTIKEFVRKANKDIPSIYIYQSVLQWNVQNVEEFFQWFEKQERSMFNTWKPV